MRSIYGFFITFSVRTIQPSVSEFHRFGDENNVLRRLYCRWGISPRPKAIKNIVDTVYIKNKTLSTVFYVYSRQRNFLFSYERKIHVKGASLAHFAFHAENKAVEL